MSTFPYLFDIISLSYDPRDYLLKKPYFSKDLNSPILSLNDKDAVFAAVNDERFTKAIKEQMTRKWRFMDVQDKEGKFLVNKIYREVFKPGTASEVE